MEVWLGLLGALLGGSLVIVGDVVRRRAEERRHWAEELRTAAGAIIETYGAAESALNHARRTGSPKPGRDDLLYDERYRKWGYFRMTPQAWRLGEQLQGLIDAFVALTDAFEADDDSFAAADARMFQAIIAMEDGVRQLIDRTERKSRGLPARRSKRGSN